MLFNSYTFWAFLLVVLVLYRALPHRGQNWLLVVASYFFYGAWDWRFLSLIWLSTAVDYVAGIRISASSSPTVRRAFLLVSICTNLGLLGVFKYYDFFARELTELLAVWDVSVTLPWLDVLLPVGISFYTFQTMSYTIDVYRGKCEPSRSVLDFALFVCFFPQLVAGPIERFSRLMPQITRPRAVASRQYSEGLYHILIGLFKKVVVADNMAAFVDAIFQTPASQLTGLECVVGVYAFAFQIYGDFSGYSSIAQGVAKWMGFDLMFNFRMPYFAVSPSDFWRRWHISLSSWLRDYLYVPLGGNRHGAVRTYRNLLLTMILGGLWHGAGWTFLAWGLFHGMILCAYRLFAGGFRDRRQVVGRTTTHLLSLFITFHLVCIGWLFFRAASIGQAWAMLQRIGSDPYWFSVLVDPQRAELAWTGLGLIAFFAGPLTLYELWVERSGDMLMLLRVHWVWRALAYCYAVLMLWFLPPPVHHVFIYFQF